MSTVWLSLSQFDRKCAELEWPTSQFCHNLWLQQTWQKALWYFPTFKFEMKILIITLAWQSWRCPQTIFITDWYIMSPFIMKAFFAKIEHSAPRGWITVPLLPSGFNSSRRSTEGLYNNNNMPHNHVTRTIGFRSIHFKSTYFKKFNVQGGKNKIF